MLFIDSDPVDVRVRSADRDDKGRLLRGGKRALHAQFRRGEAPDWARAIGVATFEMKNRPEEIQAGDWLAAYDSLGAQQANGYTDDERKLIEDRLLELGYLPVEKPKIAAPYPLYDQHRKTHGQRKVEHAIKDILAAYEVAGFDVEHAIAYEKQEGNSPEVIAALEGLLAAGEEDEAEPLIAA